MIKRLDKQHALHCLRAARELLYSESLCKEVKCANCLFGPKMTMCQARESIDILTKAIERLSKKFCPECGHVLEDENQERD